MGDEQPSRRRFLATAAALSTVALSGCGSGGDATTTEADGGTPTPSPEPTDTPEPTATPRSADTPTATPEPADTPTATPEPADTPTATPEPAGELTDWPSYQVDSGNTGHQPDTGGPHDSVSVRWTVDVDQNEVNSAPILVDGTLYVGAGGPGDKRGTFYAIDAATGEVAWSEKLDAPITGGAAYDATQNLVYVGTGSGLIKAYQPGGTEFWNFEIQSTEVLTAPVVGDGNVYFGSNAGRLFKFNALDGTKKWTFNLTGEVSAAPAYADGRIVISSKNNKVLGVSASGTEEWSNGFDSNANGVAIRDGTAYATSGDGSVASLNSAGRRNWTARAGGPVLSPPAVTDSAVFAGSDDEMLVALERSTGAERWRFERPNDKVSAPPVVADGTVYFGCQDSRVYAVDAQSGEMEWSKGTGAPIDNAAPVVAGGTVFIGSDDGTVYAFSE